MKIAFTEYTEADPEYKPGKEHQFGGYVTVTAESLADTARLVDYFKLSAGDQPEQLIKRAELLMVPDLQHIHRPKKRPYYEIAGSLSVELFQPYRDWARKTFGFEGRFPDLRLPFKWDGLRPIYLGVSMGVEVGETVCYTVCIESQPWNNQTAQDYAEKNATRYIAEDFGHVEPVREFIQKGSHFVHNPKYGTGYRHPVTPRIVNESLCSAFVEWWLESEATPGQLDLIERNRQLAEVTGKYSLVDWMKSYDGVRYVDSDGDCDYTGKGLMTSRVDFKEFATL